MCSGADGQYGFVQWSSWTVGLFSSGADGQCGAVCNGAARLDSGAPRLFGAVCNGAAGQCGAVCSEAD